MNWTVPTITRVHGRCACLPGDCPCRPGRIAVPPQIDTPPLYESQLRATRARRDAERTNLTRGMCVYPRRQP